METIREIILNHFNFWMYTILLMIGMYAMITKRNLIKKLIGMSIFQTAIILFFVSLGVKEEGNIPIVDHRPWAHHEEEGEHGGAGIVQPATPEETTSRKTKHELDPDRFTNPLPHVLMLTAIVVGVGTLGVALAICQIIFRHYGTLEEDEILARIRSSNG